MRIAQDRWIDDVLDNDRDGLTGDGYLESKRDDGGTRPLLSRGQTKRHYRGPLGIDEGRSYHHHVTKRSGGFYGRSEGGAYQQPSRRKGLFRASPSSA